MPTLFSRIIAGELPARFVYQDEQVVAFLSIAPVRLGHTLVVPRVEVDKWTDAEPELLAHCTTVAQRIGQATVTAFGAPRAALVIAGFEVDHLHLHVWPVHGMQDYDFGLADPSPDPADMDRAQQDLVDALTS